MPSMDAGTRVHPAGNFRAPVSKFILGMRLDLLEHEQIVAAIIECARSGASGYCCVANVHQCVLAHDDREFRDIVNGSAFTISDSTILRRALGLRYSIKTPGAVTGAKLMIALCGAANRMGLGIALVVGKDEAILGQLQYNLKSKFPGLSIRLAYSPPFTDVDTTGVEWLAGQLRASGASLIFVGLGCPKQELWMARYRPLVGAMMIGVGAAFDFNAGVVKPSPDWVHRAGLEWLYRLFSEPRRLARRYLTTSPRFLALLVVDAIHTLRTPSR